MEQDNLKNILANLTSEQLAEIAKQKKVEEKTSTQKQQQEQKELLQKQKQEESLLINRWNSFIKAEQVLKETDMKFFRDGQPKYFRKLSTKLVDKNNVEYHNTEIKFYPPGSLKENWISLDDEASRRMFRIMVEGGEIRVQNPETMEWVEKTYEPKVYDKLTNTLKNVDSKTYNMLELSDRLYPNYNEGEKPECPPVVKALVYAISGSVIMYDKDLGRWCSSKEENVQWLEKWVYGTCYADIGNNMASFPVIFGPGKVGKNALLDVIMKQLLGKEACFTGTWDLFHGSFDGYKLGKVIMFIDEVPDKGSWDTLKNMTGSTDSFVKQKYGAEFVIENTVRYVVGSNSDIYPLPVEDGPQMMRVSPIKTTKHSTFAENTIKIMDQLHYDGYCRNELKEHDNTLNVDKMDEFTVGDTLLRGRFNILWNGRDAAQQFLNYLDYTYKNEQGTYSLGPLRGKDWEEIMENKLPSVNGVVEYLCHENVETISVSEAYEIYKILQGNKHNQIATMQSFSQRFSTLMSEREYRQYKRVIIKNGTQTTMYTTSIYDTFEDYEMDIDRFIIESKLGNTMNSPTSRCLVYGKTKIKEPLNGKTTKELILELSKKNR